MKASKVANNRKGLVMVVKEEDKDTFVRKCVNCTNAYCPHELSCTGQYFLVKCKIKPFSHFVDECCSDWEMSPIGELSLDPSVDF